MSENTPAFCVDGARPPLNAIFSRLRDLWVSQGDDRTYAELGRLLGCRRQDVSQWATGSDHRRPPWSIVMTLCLWTGARLVALPEEWRVEVES